MYLATASSRHNFPTILTLCYTIWIDVSTKVHWHSIIFNVDLIWGNRQNFPIWNTIFDNVSVISRSFPKSIFVRLSVDGVLLSNSWENVDLLLWRKKSLVFRKNPQNLGIRTWQAPKTDLMWPLKAVFHSTLAIWGDFFQPTNFFTILRENFADVNKTQLFTFRVVVCVNTILILWSRMIPMLPTEFIRKCASFT